jgi:tRNA (mo5U34)-methyltransferase
MSLPAPEPYESIESAINRLGPWFHNLHLPDGSQTVPDHRLGDFPTRCWELFQRELPHDLTGWHVLDVGCNAGFYSFEMARRGAQVVGIDLDERYLMQARWAAQQYQLTDRVRFENRQVYDLAHDPRTFDLVLFLGVFYHLRYPLLGLDILAEKVRRLMVFQTLTMPDRAVLSQIDNRGLNERGEMLQNGWPKMAFIEYRLANDPTNWWAPNHAAILAMLRTTGLESISQPSPEIYICRPHHQWSPQNRWWPQDELRAATGRRRTA